jgi:hypothetical protein
MDAVLALRLLFELHREFERPLHVAYVDITAAFDSVDREALWKALKATGVPPFLLHLIQDLNDGSTSTVRVGNEISCPSPARLMFAKAVSWPQPYFAVPLTGY